MEYRTLKQIPTPLIHTIDIMGKPYSVEFSTTLMAVDDCVGKCLPSKQMICVDETQARGQLRDTLMHEVMHGVFSESGLGTEIKGEDEEETIVRRLTTGFLQVLRANPKFTKLLTETDK